MADLVMVVFIGGLVLAGWRSGFVRRLIGLVFVVVSLVAGVFLRAPAGAIVNSFLPKIPSDYAQMLGYAVAFAALMVVLNLLAHPIVSRVPQHGLSEATDKALGAILGLAEGVLIVSAAIVVLHTYSDAFNGVPGFKETGFLTDIKTQVDDSTIGQALESTTVPIVLAVIGPILPSDVKSILPQSIPGLPKGIPGFPTVPSK